MTRAYSFLSALGPDMSSAEEKRYEDVLAMMGAGTRMKKTFRSRLASLDTELVRLVEERFSDVPLLRIHDVGASTAITSVELLERLAAIRPTAVHATDRYDYLTAVDAGPGMTVFFDVDGHPIQFAFGKWGLTVTRRHPRRALSRLLSERARRRLADGQRISLFHPKALALAEVNPHFTLGHYDLFVPNGARYEVVRAMNVLMEKSLSPDDINVSSPEKISEGIASLSDQVVDGGLLILGRRDDVTIFAKSGDRMMPILTLGEGYALADLVR